MHLRILSEKQYCRREPPANKIGHVVISILLHTLLWTSFYVVSTTLYVTISTMTTDEAVLVPAVIAAVTGLVSISYVALHNLTTYLSRSTVTEPKNDARSKARWFAMVALRSTLTLWLIACGLSITFTLARHPRCSSVITPGLAELNSGIPCVIQRSIIAASLLALISTLTLFIIIHKIEDPFRSHLLGVAKEHALLPLMLPYKAPTQRPMFSEMSFKCRSSTSLTSHTLRPSCDSTTNLLPKNPDRVVGLGIYGPKTSAATFLRPRPSLSSIRTHTTIGTPPPSSPLPPLPAYFPEKYRTGSAMHKAVYPPRRPARPERTKSQRTVRIVPPSPALSIANLKMHNSSIESLSSVYSRSISGESQSPKPVRRPTGFTDGSRSFSSGSTATIIKSPLGAMRLADRPEVVVSGKSSRQSSESSCEIDDVATLQAKLPSVTAVSEFGDIQAWVNMDKSVECTQYGNRASFTEKDSQRKLSMPLLIRKTRDSGSMFVYSKIKAIV